MDSSFSDIWESTAKMISMCSTTITDKTTRDAANPDSDADIVGHNDLKDEIDQVVIQIK
jgi:hypothetical protein